VIPIYFMKTEGASEGIVLLLQTLSP
jgi:hypothetical protein